MSATDSSSIHTSATHAPSVEPVVAPVSAKSSCLSLDLLTWKDPVQTGKIFGSIIASLIVFKTVNLFNVFFHLAYIGLLLSAAAEYAGRLVTGTGFVTKYGPSTNAFANQFNNEVLPLVAKFNVKLEKEFQSIVYAHDIETTLKAAGLSYILFKITSWFSIFTLFTTSVVLAFTVPAVYLKNRKQIDALVAEYSACAKSRFANVSKLAKEKAAPIVENLIEKSGPLGNFINSKFPTRTAGSTVGPSKATFGTKADEVSSVKVPSTASTSGASKFPDVPAQSLNSHVIDDAIDQARAVHAESVHSGL